MTFNALVLGIPWIESEIYSQMIHDDGFLNHQQRKNFFENIPLYENSAVEAWFLNNSVFSKVQACYNY